MRVVLQRVSSASVAIDGRVAGQIERGLLVFVGIEDADTAADGEWLAQKIVKLRIFADAAGQMNLSLLDLAATFNSQHRAEPKPGEGGSTFNTQLPGILLISQFTLHASTQKGTRPSFHKAGKPEHARPLYEQFIAQLSAALPAVSSGEPGRPHRVQTGEFGAVMQVSLVNDGPVTLVLDSKLRE